jgi:hypothetical protein
MKNRRVTRGLRQGGTALSMGTLFAKWPRNRLFGQIVAKKSGLTTSSFLNSRE